MKLIVTKRSGDSRTWVTKYGFNSRQVKEIVAFKAEAHAEPGKSGQAITSEFIDAPPGFNMTP